MEKGIWWREPMVPLSAIVMAIMMLPIALGRSAMPVAIFDRPMRNAACHSKIVSSHGTGRFLPAQAERNDRRSLLHRADVGAVREPEEEVIDPARQSISVTHLGSPPADTGQPTVGPLGKRRYLRFPSTLLNRDHVHIGIAPPIARRIRRGRRLELPVLLGEPLARLDGAAAGQGGQDHFVL